MPPICPKGVLEQRENIVIGQGTHKGLVRSQNEDSCGYYTYREPVNPGSKGHLFIVADGMGGHAAGQEASKLAVESVSRAYFADPAADPADSLERAVDYANRQIRDHSISKGNRGMGTTCTALVINRDHGWIGHVGDSRAYRIRGGRMEQLTQDHTYVRELQLQGVIDENEARTHPQRNLLTRAIGAKPTVEIDVVGPFEIDPGDTFLLCSDGLRPVEDEIILSTVVAHDPQTACEILIQLANNRGGRDNITVQIVRSLRTNSTVPVSVVSRFTRRDDRDTAA